MKLKKTVAVLGQERLEIGQERCLLNSLCPRCVKVELNFPTDFDMTESPHDHDYLSFDYLRLSSTIFDYHDYLKSLRHLLTKSNFMTLKQVILFSYNFRRSNFLSLLIFVELNFCLS